MSSSTKTSWPKTLAARLTIWYSLLSSLSFLVVFVLAYLLVSTLLLQQVDDDLVEDIDEFNMMYRDLGSVGMWEQLEQEVTTDGAQNLFFQLYTERGELIRQTNDNAWRGMPIIENLSSALVDGGEPLLRTLNLEQQEYPARSLYGVLQGPNGNSILQVVETLEERSEILELLLTVFFVSLPLFLILSLTAGWYMSHRSLAGVEEVTNTAIDISNGAINQRVGLGDRGEEIDRLAATFNSMLDKIQVLIKGMREMTDNIAHDLKSPLARIRGMAETTITGEKSDNQYQLLAGSTIEECDRLLHLINTMLDLSETEAGLSPSMEPLNLTSLVNDACELFQPLAAETNIDLVCECEAEIVIDGNKAFLQRLIGNLLDNAIKYTPSGGKVTIQQQTADNDVLIQVADTGTGIKEKDLPKIFERFYRCDLSRSKPGSGLGLSLAAAIAKAHFGSISVTSTPKKGSLFTVKLPLSNSQLIS